LLGQEREPEREPPSLFERAAIAKAERKRELAGILTGRQQPRDAAGRFVPAAGFDGGAARESVPVPESHEETVARLLHTREATVHQM
jgi:hypothetical protein